MITLRGFLPQQDSQYTGKVEAATVKGSFDSVFRILLPTQKTTYSGKVETVGPTYTFFNNILEPIFKEIPQEVLSDGECC